VRPHLELSTILWIRWTLAQYFPCFGKNLTRVLMKMHGQMLLSKAPIITSHLSRILGFSTIRLMALQ
jgi:hypothetical protein